MKKVIIILILALNFTAFNVAAERDRSGKDRYRTENRDNRRPGGHGDDRSHDNYGKGKNHGKGKHDHDQRHHGGDRNHKDFRPGGHYRPATPPPPPPRPRHAPRPPRRPHVNPAMAYVIGTANVIFNGLVMNDVNLPTFEVLGYGYARDAFFVFYNGKRLKGADPRTFRILNDGYARDAWNVYYYGRLI